MTAIDLGTILSWPAATHPDPPQPTGPWAPRTDSDMPVAVDPALDGWEPPTLDDLGLTADPVAMVRQLRMQIDELIAGMTDQQRADLAQYEQTRTHLRRAA
ncbi:hypothetical protein AB0I37_25105 [Micromonospora purpureochromogenes]|uniref:hypothetical protein n=1 Tax=Micromonospora purpureochromogenes TaxID=47872 RepID=UPI0033FD4FA7